jgi:hypothetical protein
MEILISKQNTLQDTDDKEVKSDSSDNDKERKLIRVGKGTRPSMDPE